MPSRYTRHTPTYGRDTTRDPRYFRARERVTTLGVRRGLTQKSLTPWPFILPFAGYILWWVLGLGDMVWLVAAAALLVTWAGARGMKLPSLAVIWLLFLLWVAISITMVDTPGRGIGATYRLALYFSAGVLALHTYNARDRLTPRVILASMTAFLASATIGGYIALAMPELVIHTPMSYILPDALLRNDLVNEMVIRRTTQWNPNAWIVQAPRPAAPFLYANTWGNVYSLLLPLSLLHLRLEFLLHSRWRLPVALICAVSVPVATLTLNRGMFIGLAVVALWVGVQMLRAGAWTHVLVGAGSVIASAVVWALSPAGAQLSTRLETTNSTEDRSILYMATIDEVARSPLLGFGAPRPAPQPWLPSLGTQGQLWTVLFSHGIVGALLFMGFFVWAFALAIPRIDLMGAVLGGVTLATLVETIFYGMMTGVMISTVVAFVILRGDHLPQAEPRRRLRRGQVFSRWDPRRRSPQPTSTPHLPAPA